MAARLLVLVGVRKPVFALPAACNLSNDLLVVDQAIGNERWRREKAWWAWLTLTLRTTDHAVFCFPIPNLVPLRFGILISTLARPYSHSRFLVQGSISAGISSASDAKTRLHMALISMLSDT